MPNPVLDLGSNLEENLKRWSNALKGMGEKFSVWNVIYSGKRKRRSAKEISEKLNGKVTPKRVTEAGKKLIGDGLIRRVPDQFPIIYEKIDEVHHYKRQILALVKSKTKREGLPTKRGANLTVKVQHTRRKQGRAIEVTIDDIDQFSKVKHLKKALPKLEPLSENEFKNGIQKLFKDTGVYKDWGGEKNDFYTNKLRIRDKRYTAGFALKGPGVGTKKMEPGKWGKNGDQIQRLSETPASVFFLQFEGQIDQNSIDQLKKLTENKAHQENRTLFYGYIDRDDSTSLRIAIS
jgi:hypothetical protein